MSEISDLKKKLAMSSRMLFNSGLVDYSGHISVRVPGSDHLLILPHPVSRASVAPDDMVVTDFDGKLIDGKYKAPSEVFIPRGRPTRDTPLLCRTYAAGGGPSHGDQPRGSRRSLGPRSGLALSKTWR